MGKAASRITRPKAVPPLRDGDRMDADEFLRRYAADKVVHTAELLKGVVHVTRRRESRNGEEMIVPPISAGGHGTPSNRITTWATVYSAYTPGVESSGSVTTILPSNATGLEPDGILRVLPENGGRSALGPDDYIRGVPELLVEVSYSSAGRDLGKKYEAFEADGVPEYLVWRTDVGEVHWFALKGKKYAALTPDADGTLRSGVFPGLWLDVAALLAGDMAKVLATLQQGLASPEHAAFVAKLHKAAGKRKRK